MDTLVELFDERAIENVLGAEMFKPKNVIYLCPPELVDVDKFLNTIKSFFKKRGLQINIKIVKSSLFETGEILAQLEDIYKKYPNIGIDVTGGNDAALFATGMFCQKTKLPAFTYSRKNNRFYNIMNADFAENVKCTLNYSVEDFFLMAGGTLRKGRVDNNLLSSYEKDFDKFFDIFLQHKREWPDQITFFQRISRNHHDEEINLSVSGMLDQKGEHGRRVYGSKNLLTKLRDIGFLTSLEFFDEQVSFTFKDEQIRAWLRDVGSALELYMYEACRKTGIFGDVISSAIVDWDGYVGHDSVSNEIDVVATRGVTPIFISCKACDVKTEALNELAIIRDRFGGKGAKAVIATTESINAAARHRAAQLGIAVIDIEEMISSEVPQRLKVIMKCYEG